VGEEDFAYLTWLPLNNDVNADLRKDTTLSL